ncbi:hypothetical protein [Parasitella parasitica]|uniref:Extracellular membrane protein CFEM domain-containing protein n=1 Tax=Parasitella parasitica TaxID=35722 RepID=A0A0B7MY14_9FUNG|nr:hypothetical protein [Parasitella parasitica]
MKFSSVIVLGLGFLVASCSAACNCKATDQACLDKCVIAANSCIVKCENQGNACQEACITSNWPSAMPKAHKDVLASSSDATATGTATSMSGTMSATASLSASVSTYPSTLSGGSTIMVTSTISSKPTSSLAGGKATGSSVPKSNIDNTNASAANKQAVLGWSFAAAGVVAGKLVAHI